MQNNLARRKTERREPRKVNEVREGGDPPWTPSTKSVLMQVARRGWVGKILKSQARLAWVIGYVCWWW